MFLTLPEIGSGTVEERLAQIRSYVCQSNEQINILLGNVTVEKFWDETYKAVSSGFAGVLNNPDEGKEHRDKYTKLRDLIINTADSVAEHSDKLNMVLQGSYVAKSELGEFIEHTTMEIQGDSKGITEMFTYAGANNSGTVRQKNYIRQGLLDENNPIYGIEIGLLSDEYSHGEIVDSVTNKKIRITPDRLGLWDEADEIAYISNGAIYFPSAHISGGSINIGSNNFKVDSSGNIETAGDIKLGSKFHIDNSGDIVIDDMVVETIHMKSAGKLRTQRIDLHDYDLVNSNYGGFGVGLSNSNYGVSLSCGSDSKYLCFSVPDIGSWLVYTKANGFWQGCQNGLYVCDANTRYLTFTGNITVDGTTLNFVNGLFVGAGVI